MRSGNDGGWQGPSLAKLRANFLRADYQRPEREDKLPNTEIGQTVLWLATGDAFAELDAVAWATEAVEAGFGRARGSTPSYAGISVQRVAAMYDWLRGHGDIDPVTRRLMMHHLEAFAGGYLDNWLKKKASSVFYSRRWGCLGAVGVAGLALFGDAPRAPEMVEYAVRSYYSEDGLGTIRQAQDGATGGSGYGLHHAFTDCANLAAAMASATDWDVAAHIRDQRGDWLRTQVLFQMHSTYPDGGFLKDGDRWGSAVDSSQYRMQVDGVSGLYRDGIAGAWRRSGPPSQRRTGPRPARP